MAIESGATGRSWLDPERIEQWCHAVAGPAGTLLVNVFHYVGLFVIGAATVWAAGGAFLEMLHKKPHGTVEDLLLLFIFLEIGAMVGIYFKTNHMPVRFLIYVAITAVTRHMIGVVNHPGAPVLDLLIMAGSILLLAVALIGIRYASHAFPAVALRKGSFETDVDRSSKP